MKVLDRNPFIIIEGKVGDTEHYDENKIISWFDYDSSIISCDGRYIRLCDNPNTGTVSNSIHFGNAGNYTYNGDSGCGTRFRDNGHFTYH